MDTVRITIDGRELTVAKGRTVLEAALDHGIELPYYCFHPGLGVDGSCRGCILCPRCVRFMRDVDGDAQIGIADRGAGSEIATYKEEGVHSLLSGNLMDVCPVGAITTRDYRFKSRPWDNPLAADTICTFCSKGCNTTVWIKAKPEWAKGPAMARVTPRFNPDVNGYWMCDIGRFDYHWAESDARLTQPLVRTANGVQQPVAWHDALRALEVRLAENAVDVGTTQARLAEAASGSSAAKADSAKAGLVFLTSAHASLEELHLLKRLATAIGSNIT